MMVHAVTRPLGFFVVLAGLAGCKKTEATVDAAAATTASAASADAGDPLADDEVEFGDAPDAGCPIPVHPGYCRGRCKGFAARKISRHAARVSDPARSAIGKCGTYDVFAERDARDAGITEYYDGLGVLVAAHDDRQRGCTDFGTIPKCDPVLEWKPAGTVRFGAPTVVGGLPPEVVGRIVRQFFNNIRQCYATALGRDPSIHGDLVLSIAIGPSGAPTSVATTKDSTVTDAALTACVVTALKGASFPQPDPPGSATATMTLTFGSK